MWFPVANIFHLFRFYKFSEEKVRHHTPTLCLGDINSVVYIQCVFKPGLLSLPVTASQENNVVVGSARFNNGKCAKEDIMSLVNNQITESLKKLLPPMLIESLSDKGLTPSSSRTSNPQLSAETLTSQKKFLKNRKKATRIVMILYQVLGLVGSIVRQITRVSDFSIH